VGFSANCDLEIWPAWNSTIWIKSLISWLKRFSILLNAKIKAYMTWLNFSLLTSMPRKKKHVFWSSLLMSRNWFKVLWTVDWLRCDSEVDKLKPSPWWRILKSTWSYVGSLMNVSDSKLGELSICSTSRTNFLSVVRHSLDLLTTSYGFNAKFKSRFKLLGSNILDLVAWRRLAPCYISSGFVDSPGLLNL